MVFEFIDSKEDVIHSVKWTRAVYMMTNMINANGLESFVDKYNADKEQRKTKAKIANVNKTEVKPKAKKEKIKD